MSSHAENNMCTAECTYLNNSSCNLRCHRSKIHRMRALWVKPKLQWAKNINMPINQYRAFRTAMHADSVLNFPL